MKKKKQYLPQIRCKPTTRSEKGGGSLGKKCDEHHQRQQSPLKESKVWIKDELRQPWCKSSRKD